MLACITVFFFRVFLVFFMVLVEVQFSISLSDAVVAFCVNCCCFLGVLLIFWLKGNWNWLFWCTINAWEWSVMGLYCEFQLFMRWKFSATMFFSVEIAELIILSKSDCICDNNAIYDLLFSFYRSEIRFNSITLRLERKVIKRT